MRLRSKALACHEHTPMHLPEMHSAFAVHGLPWMTVLAIFVVFRLMGRDYDAAVMTAGFAGLGLGATPVDLANMSAVTNEYEPSPKAFLVVPLVGAFFIDLPNAVTIKFFIDVTTKCSGRTRA